MRHLYFAAALILLLLPLTRAQSQVRSAAEEVPTVAFCAMVEHPDLYFDKPVRLTATLDLGDEAQYLSDDKCVLSHDEQIGVGYVATSGQQRELLNSELRKAAEIEYGGHARITVVGILRNSSMRAFAWYHYRFDLIRVENIFHIVVPYEGTLQAGITYRADVRKDKLFGLSLVIPLRMLEHYAVRIEWTNLDEFSALKRLRNNQRERQIVFSVISDQIKQMTERRWNRTVQCKVIKVE